MKAGKAVGIGIGVLLGLVALSAATDYLTGFFFLLLSKRNPMNATFLTAWQYWHYYGDAPAIAGRLKAAFFISAGICVLLPVIIYAQATAKRRELHGSARFATDGEVRKAKLDATQGILVGRHKGKFLMFGGQQFVLLAAPTRAGKGVGIVIPNLLNYNDSVVVLDVKQENYDITAGFRAKYGQAVYLFNPFAEDMRTHRYNPLGYISDNPHFRNGDILAIGYALWPGHGKDPFFDDQARNLFLGMCLFLCETPELPRTIGELLRQSSGNGKPIKEYLAELIAERAAGDRPLSNDCVDALNRFTSTSDNTLASILASFNAPLVIWANPIVDAATSAGTLGMVGDFDLRDVRKKKMTVYIGITPDHLAEAALLVNVLFSQLVNLNTKELPSKNPELKYQCLLLMDEFTAIGKVGIIAKAVSYMAGYNLRLLPIIQSVSQLSSVYGQEDARTFITNHALQILYAPREQKDANEYSEMLGYETVKGKSKSRNIGSKAGMNSGSESTSDQRRALLLPQEIKEIGQWKEIVMLENVKPILCDKIRYFDDPVFTARLLPAPPVPLLDLDQHLAKVQQRVRELTSADVEKGVDLAALAVDMDSLPVLVDDDVSPAEVAGYVNAFFASLGADDDDDDAEGEQAGEGGAVEPVAAVPLPSSPDGAQDAASEPEAPYVGEGAGSIVPVDLAALADAEAADDAPVEAFAGIDGDSIDLSVLEGNT